ncbi:MAG: ABC transporter ATP-binding protein [Microbacteriaceae bacterium]
MTAILKLEGVNQRFGGLHALKDVNYEVIDGEILGIIGPNGAGKSTMFNAIVGLIPPVSGKITFQGQDIIGKQVHEVVGLGLAKTSQHVQVFNEMTVLDNLAVAGLLKHGTINAARERGLEELRFWGMDDIANVIAEDITLAQRSTLELARTMMLDPTLLLIDEVMAGLNEVEVDQMLDRMIKINKERGVTLIVIEHNMRAIMRISHRVLALDYGQVIALGDPTMVSTDKRVVEAYLGVES